MMISTKNIETINFALILCPSRCSQLCRATGPPVGAERNGAAARFGFSIAGMDGHRKSAVNHLVVFAQCREVRLLLREDWQVLGRQSKDGEAEGYEHGRDHRLRPPGSVTAMHRAFDAGDSHIETIGHETEQTDDGSEVQALRAFPDLRHQQHAERDQHREEDLQQKEALLITRLEDQAQNAAMVEVLELKDAV